MIPQSYRLWLAEEAGGEIQVGYVIGWHLPIPLADAPGDADSLAIPVVVFVSEDNGQQYWTGFPTSGNCFYADTKDEAVAGARRFADERDEHNRRELAKTQKTEAHA